MRAKLPGCRYPDVAVRRGQGGADAQVRPQLKLSLRGCGYSWAEIGSRLGITRQAAQQRWGRAS